VDGGGGGFKSGLQHCSKWRVRYGRTFSLSMHACFESSVTEAGMNGELVDADAMSRGPNPVPDGHAPR
jgi:hypothetical protein